MGGLWPWVLGLLSLPGKRLPHLPILALLCSAWKTLKPVGLRVGPNGPRLGSSGVPSRGPLEPAPEVPTAGLLKTLGARACLAGGGRCGTWTPCSAGQARLPQAEPNLQRPGLRLARTLPSALEPEILPAASATSDTDTQNSGLLLEPNFGSDKGLLFRVVLALVPAGAGREAAQAPRTPCGRPCCP